MAPHFLLAFIAGVGLGGIGVGTTIVFPLLAAFCGVLAALAVLDKKRLYAFLLVLFLLLGMARTGFGAIELSFLESSRERLKSAVGVISQNLSQALVEPYASYASGILVGDRSGIPLELRDAFYKTGTSHIMALSGYNVTIIIDFLGKIFGGFWLSTIGVVLFVLATGAAPSLVRASIMGILVLLTKKYGHGYRAGHALLAAVALMLFFDSQLLLGDLGFQLSVAATAGLIWFVPEWQKQLKNMPSMFGLRDALITTIAAQLATLPLILWYFGGVSWVSLPANVLVQIAMPGAMFFTFLAGVFGLISHVFAWPAFVFLAYQIFVVRFFAAL